MATAVLATVALTTITPASPAASTGKAPDQGSIGMRILDAPASAKTDPRARLYVVDHLKPGATIRRRLELSNTTNSTARVQLYPAGATIADGVFVGTEGRTANELSTWTTVSPKSSEVPAGGRVRLTVTIKVARDAAPGEQYGVVWAEARKDPSAGGGVVQVNRVGIRLYVSVGGGNPPAADFEIDSLTAQRAPDGQPSVVAKVHNTGGRALDMNGSLKLAAGPGGLTAGPFPATLGTTLGIDQTETVTIALDKLLPAGPWKAQINLKSGLLKRDAKASITFPDLGVVAAPVSATTEVSGRPGWWYSAIGGSIALLLLIVGLFVLLWRRRRSRRTRHAY